MHLCALVFVAHKANFALRFLCEHFILRLMNCMARHAGHVVTLMCAVRPMDAFSGCVAIEAGTTLRVDGRLGRAAENKIRRRAGRCTGLLTLVPHMRAAGTVAGLTSRLPGNTVTRAMNRQDRFALVRAVTTRADRITAGAGGECGGGIGRVGVCRENNFTNGPSDGEREPDDKRMQAAGICVSPGHACSLMQALLLHEDRSGKLMPSLIRPPN